MSTLPGLQSKREKLFAIRDFLEFIEVQENQYNGHREQLIPLIPFFANVYEITGIDPADLNSAYGTINEQFSGFTAAEAPLSNLKVWVSKAYEWVGVRDLFSESTSVTIFDSKLPIQASIHMVQVPVVETTGHQASGRLRNLMVKTIGNTPENHNELTKVFSVIGGSKDQTNNNVIRKATNRLVDELSLKEKKKWQSTASFECNEAWHSGNSADLAMGGLFLCSILEAMDIKEQFRLNPAIAITGEITETGEVKSVYNASIKQKVEAVFYSWTQLFVVPEKQLSIFYQYYDELKEDYPKRDVLIIGVRHLRDLFYDRRLTMHSKKSTIEHARNRLWKKKFSAIAILGYLVMASIIAALVIGPIDNNPQVIEFAGTKMIVKNQFGNQLLAKEVGGDLVKAVQDPPFFEITFGMILDLDSDGQNEFLWKNRRTPEEPREIIYAGNVHGDTLWTLMYEKKLDYKEHEYVEPSEFSFRQILYTDVDNDGDAELIISSNHSKYFPTIFIIANRENGSIERELLHHGHVTKFIIEDLNGDNTKEIIFGGINNANKIGFLSVVSMNQFEGQLTVSENYTALDIPIIQPLFYVQFPQSEVSRLYANRANFLTQLRSIKEVDSGVITTGVVEFLGNKNDGRDEVVNLHYNFDKRLRLLNIAPIDDYDVLTRELYQKRLIDFETPGAYLSTFKDSLQYWNGYEFVSTPTMNQRFFEAVGADSTKYLEWYTEKK